MDKVIIDLMLSMLEVLEAREASRELTHTAVVNEIDKRLNHARFLLYTTPLLNRQEKKEGLDEFERKYTLRYQSLGGRVV